MQIELTLLAPENAGYSARDLGFLLHKNPAHLHERETTAGKVSIFYTVAEQARCTAVLYLDIDPIGLVRGKSPQSEGLLDQYVNDRPYVANSFLSVALGRSFGQSMSGKSKEKQALADQTLPFEARIVPVAIAGGVDLAKRVFEPLGYAVSAAVLDDAGPRGVYDLRIAADIKLSDLLNHLYVLVPVLDNAKHWWIDADEVEKLLEKGDGWLPNHPAKELIARRALKHRPTLVYRALERLAEGAEDAESADDDAAQPEETLEKPIRLHELRLESVAATLKSAHAARVLDLGCGEGRLMERLIKERGIIEIVGVDASARILDRAARRLRLAQASEAKRDRVKLQLGSLTYGDRRWQGFDAATLVEVIEHIDASRLSALELSLFGDAKPRLVIVTTPNREYNALFEDMPENALRHPDHRFEWTRAEFEAWAGRVAETYGYALHVSAIGPVDDSYGAPSQMAVFRQSSGHEEARTN
ncbi:MAG: 3' terminal RNA ribose 2'-O-methyltransferase Hen1 [Pseudomonadota bacterium]